MKKCLRRSECRQASGALLEFLKSCHIAVMVDDPTLNERAAGAWVTVPVAPELREQIKRAAEADHRSVASWARVALIERLASQERAA